MKFNVIRDKDCYRVEIVREDGTVCPLIPYPIDSMGRVDHGLIDLIAMASRLEYIVDIS